MSSRSVVELFVDEMLRDGEQGELEAVAHAELCEDARQMMLHGFLAQLALLRNLSIAEAGGHQRYDFELSGGETKLRVVGRRGPRAQRVDQLGHALTSYPVLAGHYRAHGFHEQLRRRFLHDQTARAELQRLHDLVALDVRGEDDGSRG